jgi:hypothetical protein
MWIVELVYWQLLQTKICSRWAFVGPIVSPKIFKVIDGVPTFSEPHVQFGINRFRGPYPTASDWLSSHLKAEMFVVSSMQIPEANLSRDDITRALEHMERAVQYIRVTTLFSNTRRRR